MRGSKSLYPKKAQKSCSNCCFSKAILHAPLRFGKSFFGNPIHCNLTDELVFQNDKCGLWRAKNGFE